MDLSTMEMEYFDSSNPWIPGKWALENSYEAQSVTPFTPGSTVVKPSDYAMQLSEPSSLFAERVMAPPKPQPHKTLLKKDADPKFNADF